MDRVINSLFVRFFVLLTCHLLYTLAVVNVTIDDTHGDPITGVQIQYSPSSDWSYGPDCGYCASKPDAARAGSGTWHDNLYTSRDAGGSLATAEVKFTGVAVYVYGILNSGRNTGTTDLAFQIDGETMGTYSQPIFDSSGLNYNMVLFSKQSLPSALHTLTIVNGASRGSTSSLLLLDYIVYSQEEKGPSLGSSATHTSTSSTSSTSTTTSDSTQTSSADTTHIPSTANTLLGQIQSTNTPSLASTNSNPTQSDSPNSTWVSSPTSATSNPSKTPAIIGAVIGSLAAIIVFLVLFFICRRRRRQRYPGENDERMAVPFRAAPWPPRVVAEKPPEKLPFPDASVTEFSEQPTTTAYAASATTETTRERHPQMVPVETALTLAAEVDRLREILRLQAPPGSAQPPPYVHQDDPPTEL